MLGLKLNHVNKRGPRKERWELENICITPSDILKQYPCTYCGRKPNRLMNEFFNRLPFKITQHILFSVDLWNSIPDTYIMKRGHRFWLRSKKCTCWWTNTISQLLGYSISQEICTRFCCALLCCGYAIVYNEFTWSIYSYSSGLLCWHWGNRQIATVPVK